MTTLASTIRIGRVPRGRFHNAERIRWDGDRISGLSGRTTEADTADLPIVREQILGLANTVDQPVVPLDCTAEPSLDGYYAVGRVRADFDPGASALGHFGYDIELTRLPDRDIPRLEFMSVGGLRSNSHSIAAGAVVPWLGIPAATPDYWNGEATALPFTFDTTRACATAPDGVGLATYATTGIARRLARFSLPPTNYHDGAAELSLDGNPVVGRRIHNSDAATNNWQVSNGIVTVTPGATAGTVNIANLNAAGTTTTDRDFDLIYYDSGTPLTIDAFTTLTVIRNTPEVVVARVGCRSGTRLELAVLDITMRRGARLAECTFRTETSTAKKIQCTTASAGTAGTSLIYASSGAERWMMLTPQSWTDDTTQGGMTITSSRADFGIGHHTHGDSTPEGRNDLRDQYFGVVEPWQVIVGR